MVMLSPSFHLHTLSGRKADLLHIAILVLNPSSISIMILSRLKITSSEVTSGALSLVLKLPTETSGKEWPPQNQIALAEQ